MNLNRPNANDALQTRNRSRDIAPQSGICSRCLDGCKGNCDMFQATFRGRELLYPQPFGSVTAGGRIEGALGGIEIRLCQGKFVLVRRPVQQLGQLKEIESKNDRGLSTITVRISGIDTVFELENVAAYDILAPVEDRAQRRVLVDRDGGGVEARRRHRHHHHRGQVLAPGAGYATLPSGKALKAW